MTDRNVLITGCSSGIGRALAEEFLRQGFRVYAGARNTDSLNNLTSEQLTPVQLDVNNPDDVEQAIQRIQQDSSALNVLINNAGYAAMGPMLDLSAEQIQQQFQTNVFAPVALVQAAFPLLKSAQVAQVINIGSVSGILTTPFSGAYCASKAAIHSLSDALRMELAPFGIKVITVQPGAIESSFGDNSLANVKPVLKDHSVYQSLQQSIEARAIASQENPTPAHEFAKELMAQILSQPDEVIRIGHGSKLLPLMKRWLPTEWVDKLLMKRFGLDTL